MHRRYEQLHIIFKAILNQSLFKHRQNVQCTGYLSDDLPVHLFID